MTPHRAPAAYAALLLAVAGFALLVLGWLGTSGRAELADQKGYVLLAALGLLTAAAGATIALSLQRRHLTARTAQVTGRLGVWLEDMAS